MDFFKKTWVRVTSWIVLFVALVVLILGGATQAEVSEGVELLFKAVAVIAGVIAFIAGHSKIKELENK